MTPSPSSQEEARELLRLADRCEGEAGKWTGGPMYDGLMDIAQRLRTAGDVALRAALDKKD
jgi:hypothetical protein